MVVHASCSESDLFQSVLMLLLYLFASEHSHIIFIHIWFFVNAELFDPASVSKLSLSLGILLLFLFLCPLLQPVVIPYF
jgi:hypothetical protein